MLRGNALSNLESLQDGALNNNDENDYDSLDDFEPGKDEMEAKNHMRERNNSVNLPLQGVLFHSNRASRPSGTCTSLQDMGKIRETRSKKSDFASRCNVAKLNDLLLRSRVVCIALMLIVTASRVSS